MKFFVLIGLYVCLNSIGQLLIKMGTLEIGEITGLLKLLNLKLLSGIFLFGLSFLTWIYILFKANLSYAFPFAVGLGYVAVIVLALIVLEESITFIQAAGMVLVGAGIILISFQHA
jgi:multidrug transporter EmrE-like cation transporter